MAGDEYQTQQIVADSVVHGSSKVWDFIFAFGELSAKILVLAIDQGVSPQVVYSAMFGCSHEPGTWILRNARFRPLLKGGYESVLREFLRDPDITYDSSQPGYDPG